MVYDQIVWAVEIDEKQAINKTNIVSRYIYRMHCKMVFNFTIRHDHAFKSCQTR